MLEVDLIDKVVHQKIRIISRKDIDISKWNQCVDQSEYNGIYGLSWFLDSVTDQNWKAIVLADYQSVLPFYSKKKVLIPYITQPLLCQFFQVYGDKIHEETLLDFAFRYFKRRFFKVDFNMKITFDREIYSGYKKTIKEMQILRLDNDYSTLKKEYHRNTLRNIKGHLQYQFTISKETDMQLLEFIYTHDPSGILKKHKGGVQNLCMTAMKNCDSYFMVAKVHTDIIGVGFFIETSHYILFMLSAMNAMGRRLKISYSIIDRIISEKAKSGKILDFGGSTLPSIARRNLSFGSESDQYHYYSHSIL
ncbi:MAG: hypothetical protein R2774_02875 [Saprospiraceae bacterium]